MRRCKECGYLEVSEKGTCNRCSSSSMEEYGSEIHQGDPDYSSFSQWFDALNKRTCRGCLGMDETIGEPGFICYPCTMKLIDAAQSVR
jgi:hypothetical protein